MSTLHLSTAAHKAALVDAIAFMNEVNSDMLLDECSGLAALEGQEFDSSLEQIQNLRKREAFINSFTTALASVPVGMSVFLEGVEVEVVRDGLQSLIDNQEEYADEKSPFSVENIKQLVLASQTSWGSLDVEALSQKLSDQASETVDGNSAAQDLLDALN